MQDLSENESELVTIISTERGYKLHLPEKDPKRVGDE